MSTLKNSYPVVVHLEETLVKRIELIIDADSIDEAMEKAEEKIANDYVVGKIILTADDFNGDALIQSECDNCVSDFHSLKNIIK